MINFMSLEGQQTGEASQAFLLRSLGPYREVLRILSRLKLDAALKMRSWGLARPRGQKIENGVEKEGLKS